MKKSTLLILLLLIQFIGFGSTVDTIQVNSQFLKKKSPIVVVTPQAYTTSNDKRFPVIYFLHGYSGNHRSWVESSPDFQQLVDQYQIIAVCVDGGYDSWYFDSPITPSYQYESYISKELIPFIDSKFKTKSEPNGRAITGLSMGGHGALYLGTRHPELFGTMASMSGGVDILPFPNNWNIKGRLGKYEENKAVWEKNAVINQTFSPSQSILIDCGIDDFFIGVNRALHQKLMDNKIPHEYTERPGAHNWQYWSVSVRNHFYFFNAFFNRIK
ncbi:alpha/beta hydrolase [Flectobacillus rivi]|uniref:Alpha/beta hydrolase family protein n=1 Tax=Flectobacillus rivi TaxID=2984209 RepID=A0ABT6Z396_9BACT|nr:alpha/beta hydrolase family protein [Flectobacillus rivi]MDI9875564.1 alpha/beta hydrolase family protein [Flectobacillus rivi]